MKKLIYIIPLVILCGCVGGVRNSIDSHANYNGQGKQITPVKVGFLGLITVSVGTVDLGLVNRDDTHVIVNGASAFSKTGIAGLNASSTATRNGSNVVTTVGYDIKELVTDVSTNAAETVGAIGTGVGNIIKESLNPAAGVVK